MYSVAERHQRKIAKDILQNQTPLMASVLGGMSFSEAYKVMFNTDLDDRLDQLIKEYGISCKGKDFTWELDDYGWNPISLKDALGKLHPHAEHCSYCYHAQPDKSMY